MMMILLTHFTHLLMASRLSTDAAAIVSGKSAAIICGIHNRNSESTQGPINSCIRENTVAVLDLTALDDA